MKNLKLNSYQTSILLKILDARETFIRNTIDSYHKEQNEINLLISTLHAKDATEVKTKQSEQARARERLGEARLISSEERAERARIRNVRE